MGIFAAEKRINKEGWNLKNQRKTDKYGSIFEEEITKQLNIVSTYDMDFIPKSDHKYLQFKVINQ